MTSIRHLVRLPYMFHKLYNSKHYRHTVPPKNTQNFRLKLPTIPEEPLKCDECKIPHYHTYECFRTCERCKKTYTRYICDSCILKFNMCENCKNKNDIEFNIMVKVISNKLSEFFDFRLK